MLLIFAQITLRLFHYAVIKVPVQEIHMNFMDVQCANSWYLKNFSSSKDILHINQTNLLLPNILISIFHHIILSGPLTTLSLEKFHTESQFLPRINGAKDIDQKVLKKVMKFLQRKY